MNGITEFLRKQKEAASPERAERRRKEWLAALDQLIQQIHSWLTDAEDEKLIKVRKSNITISEETLGTYQAPSLTLTVGTKTVTLKPIGGVIIGADGRVDMQSAKGTYMFLYLADSKKWVHGFGERPSGFPELTEKVFTDLLKRALA
jgi:hypothetical protein